MIGLMSANKIRCAAWPRTASLEYQERPLYPVVPLGDALA